MILKKCLLGVAMLVLVFSGQAFSQSSSASIGGLVTDATGGVLPGAAITVTNTATEIAQKIVTNSAGIYNIPGLPVGTYKVTAEMAGFQTQTKTDVRLSAVAQLKVNFELAVASRQDVVEISVATENILLESSSSVGVTLPEEKVTELPLVNSNVLDLIKVMGGVNMTDSPTFGADRTTFAGISAANVNLQRDGVTVNDVRWATGLNSPVYLNPELIGEFKLVIAPVDAEMGRGSGQVQVITRSGANAYHGSAVWNIQNTALDSNQWTQNIAGTQANWRNQNEYTLSMGGPIIKNKTFFFVSWDQQISKIREHDINPYVPTPCARKSIFRYFDGYQNGNYLANPSNGFGRGFPSTQRSVNADGTPRTDMPVQPSYMGAAAGQPSNLEAYSIFGPLKQAIPANDFNCEAVQVDALGNPTSDWVDYTKPWDPLRVPDTTGYVSRFMELVPQPNNYRVADGLNFGGYSWVRRNNGIDNVFGLGEGPNRKQISFRIDHNFNSSHRLSGSYSWETNNGEDAQPMWPEHSYGGNISREPTSVSISLTSTLKPTLLNEFRFGISRTQSFVVSPLHNTLDNSNTKLLAELKALYDPAQIPGWNADLPIMIGIGNPSAFGRASTFQIANGSHPYGSGRGNFGTYWGGHDPRMIYADTITWTRGKHSFKFGGEIQQTKSYQEVNGSVSFGASNITTPYASGGAAANAPNTGFFVPAVNWWETPSYTWTGMTGSDSGGNIPGVHNLINMQAGSLGYVGQYYFINKPTATTYNDVSAGEDMRISDYRQNTMSIFVKDDWKVTDDLTLNLGVRYEWYGVPYLAGGMTYGLKEGALSAFSLSGRSLSDMMQAPAFTPDNLPGPGGTAYTYKGTPSELAFIGPDSPNPSKQLYNNDNNNFGPAVGFAWQLPWGGKGKTTLRGGYQITYLPIGRASIIDAPGIVRDYNYTGTDIGYMNIAMLPQLLPVKIPSYMTTPAANPVTPVTQRQQGITVYDPNLKTPYVQNLTMSLTRNIGSSLTVDVRYIGTMSRKQTNTINLNSANFVNNGLFGLFERARRGEDPVELDNMFMGLSLATGMGPVGTTDMFGTYQTGAAHLRSNTTTRESLADGNFAGVAGALATMNINPSWNPGVPVNDPYTAGGVLRYNGYPENFIYTNPQYSSATWTGNLDHANYHSAQVQLTLRPTHGLSLSGTYTWSRNLGMLGYDDPNDRSAAYGVLNTHRSHAVTTYGTYDLPFGPNQAIASNVNPSVVGRIIGGWQLSWIVTMQTGRPGYYPAVTTLWGNGRPNLNGNFDVKSGHVVWNHGARTGDYYNYMYVNVADPQCADRSLVTDKQGLNGQCGITAIALRSDPTKIIFQNPLPGQRGNFGPGMITTPLTWNTDMALTKKISITESKSFQLRIDATNVFNHAQPSRGTFGSAGSRQVAPGDFSGNWTMMNLTHAYFWAPAQPLGYLDAKVGARTFQAKFRFDF